MDHTGKEAEAVGVQVPCPLGRPGTSRPANIEGFIRLTALGCGGEEGISQTPFPCPARACYFLAYPLMWYLQHRCRQRLLLLSPEPAPRGARASRRGESAGSFFPHLGRSALRYGDWRVESLGSLITLGVDVLEWVRDFLLSQSALGGCCIGHCLSSLSLRSFLD